jgi:hypothetical protein
MNGLLNLAERVVIDANPRNDVIAIVVLNVLLNVVEALRGDLLGEMQAAALTAQMLQILAAIQSGGG